MDIRVCHWCNEQDKCLSIELIDEEGTTFKFPVCEKCLLTSPEYSYLQHRFHHERSKRDDCTLCETVTMNEDGEDYLVRMRCSEHSGN